jgi:hypothetical protein
VSGFYESWFASPDLGPGWMKDPVGRAYWGSVGKLFDAQVSRMKTGVRARFPTDAAAMGMADALEQSGRDRMLPRGGSTPGANDEALAAWAARQEAAWTTWAKAGSAQGLLLELKAQGFPMGATGVSIFNHLGRRYYLDDAGEVVVTEPCMACPNRADKTGTLPGTPLTGFTLDARPQFFAHFCILILQDVPSLTNAAGNTAKAILNQTVRRWRQAGAHYAGASVVPTATSAKVWGWPATLKWGDTGLNWGTNGARYIAPE